MSRDLKEYDDLVKKATALDISVDKWPPRGDFKKCIRNASDDNVPQDCKNFDGLMQELTALCLSEVNSVQKDALGLNPPESPDSELQLSGASEWPQMSDGCAAAVYNILHFKSLSVLHVYCKCNIFLIQKRGVIVVF